MLQPPPERWLARWLEKQRLPPLVPKLRAMNCRSARRGVRCYCSCVELLSDQRESYSRMSSHLGTKVKAGPSRSPVVGSADGLLSNCGNPRKSSGSRLPAEWSWSDRRTSPELRSPRSASVEGRG